MSRRARHTTRAEETPEFVEFWEQVWKPHANPNDGRGAARDEFFRHVEEFGADPADLVDGARWFIFRGGNQKQASDGSGLIQQHAQSWLNKRAYEDGAEDWREYQRRLAERESNVVSMPQGPRGQTAFLRQWEQKKAAE